MALNRARSGGVTASLGQALHSPAATTGPTLQAWPSAMGARGFRVVVEGNIGSGKSELVRELSRRLGWAAGEEPVGRWAPLLEKMYREPKKYALEFQRAVQADMVEGLRAGPAAGSVEVVERSLWSAQLVFVQKLWREGVLSSKERAALRREWEEDRQRWPEAFRADAFLFLRCPPEVALERVRRRGRAGEDRLDLPALRLLDRLHREWLESGVPDAPVAPVLTLDATLTTARLANLAHHALLPLLPTQHSAQSDQSLSL